MRPKLYGNSAPAIAEYIQGLLNLEEDTDLQTILDLAQAAGTPPLQVTPTDGRLIEVLVRGVGAKKVVEIGTLCGYSTVILARSLATNGKIYTCERSAHHAAIANQVFCKLGLTEKIELLFGEAKDTLPQIEKQGPFDVVFIDADKLNYPFYFDWSVPRLRSGGLLIADNVFAFGFVNAPLTEQGNLADLVDAIRVFNKRCASHADLVTSFVPTGEGLMVAVKK